MLRFTLRSRRTCASPPEDRIPAVTDAGLPLVETDELALFFIAFLVALEPELRNDGEEVGLLVLLTLRVRGTGLSCESYDRGE